MSLFRWVEDKLIPNEILKLCDIRGKYPKPLGKPEAHTVGLAIGTLLKESKNRNIKTVIGGDIRESSEPLKKSLLQGLKESGLKVVDAGLVSTPLLNFATGFAGAAAGIMVTASHNPPEFNGFKFFVAGEPASADWIQRLYQILTEGKFRKGAGITEKKVFFPDYRNRMVRHIATSFKGTKIVVDAGNGMAGMTAPPVLLNLALEIEIMNGELDGQFPGRGADSSDPRALEALGRRVVKSKAFLGASFDGDADRISFVDEKGQEVPSEIILALLAEEPLSRQPGQKVIYDGKCSDGLDRWLRAKGGEPVLERSGHTFIYDRFKKENALMAGEASGHLFLPGAFPGDALYACLVLLKTLKNRGQTLSQALPPFPKRVSTHDVKIPMEATQALPIFEGLKARALELGGEVSGADGVRAVFKEGWGIARLSVTEPVLSCRFEAENPKKLRELAKEWLRDFPDLLKPVEAKIATLKD
jgi:phosphomannomutase/phosphoglucomutase